MSTSAEQSVTKFYDTLAPEYDQMTGFESRFAREGPFFKTLIEDHGIGTSLDAGCGTGFHSLLLSRGSFMIFVDRPVSAVALGIAFVLLISNIFPAIQRKYRQKYKT